MKLVKSSTRLLCFLGDLSLGYGLYNYLVSFLSFQRLVSGLSKGLESTILHFFISDLDFLATGLLVYICAYFIRFYGTLTFGVSFFQLACGVRAQGSWWWKRVGGALRVLMDFLLTPFVIFDFLSIFKKVNIVEKYSQTKLTANYSFKFTIVKSIGLPVVLILSFFWPLIQDFSLVDSYTMRSAKSAKEKLTNNTNFDSFKVYKSERFRLKTFSSLMDKRFALFPDFEIISLENKKRFIPYLSIYDKQNQKIGYFKLRKRILLLDILDRAQVGNPLFKNRYPNLYKVLNKDRKSYERRIYDGISFKGLIPKEVEEEMVELVSASFELGKKSLFRHVIDHGPFIRGYIELRKILKRLVRPGAILDIDFIKMGNHNFLRMTQKFNFESEYIKDQIETLIPIGTHNSLVLEFGWDKDLNSALTRNNFRRTFLAQSEWSFDFYKFFKFPELEADMTVFQVIDKMSKGDLRGDSKTILEEFLHRFYYDNTRTAFKNKDQVFLQFLSDNLDRLSKVWRIRNKTKEQYFSTIFVEQMEEMLSALKAKDKKYFNL
ncbi:hypothetical protein OAT67_05510 [Bacteriovoracaceae bacterium]|nr:hypothetical protein [Bacteriovoracaceae bacterium]